MITSNWNDLTPVEEYNGILYKRDDAFMPFADCPITGGKVRQCLSLIGKNLNKIKNECDGLVATGTSVNSPQGIVVARSAKEFSLDCLIVVGGTNAKSLRENITMQWVIDSGAQIDTKCKLGYDTTLNSRIKQIKETQPLYHIKFGINLEDNPDAIINSIAYQVQNLPHDLENLIIPTGSAITAGGVLVGLKQYGIKVKRVIVVQISGYDRQSTLKKIFYTSDPKGDWNKRPRYEYVADKTYPYSKQLKIKLNRLGEYLDPVYEAKGYDWMMKNINVKNEKTLFWIVGNSYYVRELTPQMYREEIALSSQ